MLRPTANLIRHGHKVIPDKAITMMIKGRLQQLGNRVECNIYRRRNDPACPRPGCYIQESSCHIFNGNHLSSKTTQRHDAIQNSIVDAMKETCTDILINKATLQSDRRRPDISHARLNDTSIVQVGEISCPFDTRLQQTYQFKKQKYELNWIPDRATQLEPQGLSIKPNLAVFIVGSLGLIHQDIYKELKKYNIVGKQANMLCNNLAITSLKHSYAIWKERCFFKWRHRPPAHQRRQQSLHPQLWN